QRQTSISSRACYDGLGFSMNSQFSDETAACVVNADAIHIMITEAAKFSGVLPKPIADTQATTGAVFALSSD
ncbi:MAG: glyoxalase, partial [Alphaproteobacteria bacterium]|nr:glyoxalase [Alphaproteobacteria bacterium]